MLGDPGLSEDWGETGNRASHIFLILMLHPLDQSNFLVSALNFLKRSCPTWSSITLVLCLLHRKILAHLVNFIIHIHWSLRLTYLPNIPGNFPKQTGEHSEGKGEKGFVWWFGKSCFQSNYYSWNIFDLICGIFDNYVSLSLKS